MSDLAEGPPVVATPNVALHTLRGQRTERDPAAYVTVAIMLTLAVVDVALQPSLLSPLQAGLLLETAFPLCLVAVAQTMVVLTGGIDLSVGGSFVVANALTATWVGSRAGSHQFLLLGVVAVCLLMGALNALLITALKLPPFIATLGTWSVFDGTALLILSTDGGSSPPALSNLLYGQWLGIPAGVAAFVVLGAAWLLLRTSRLGRVIYAVGTDPGRSLLAGVATNRVSALSYVAAAVLAGIAGIYSVALTSSGTPTAGDAYVLQSIAAVVIGGTALSGGRGGAGLSLVGALILTLIPDIATALNLAPWVTVAASSSLLVVVVTARSVTRRGQSGRPS